MFYFSFKKNIVVIGDKIRESYFRNPLYYERVIDLEKKMKKQCNICNANPCDIVFQCGHSEICLECFNNKISNKFMCSKCKY